METYDIIMLVVLIGATLFGAIKGFAWQLASIASIVISYMVAYKYRGPISESIQADPPWDRFLAMLILYIGTSLLIWVAFRMVRSSIDRMKLREFDRQIGALFGLAKGAMYCTLITLFAVTLSGDRVREAVVQSKSGNYIANVLDRSDSVIPEELHDVVQPYLDRFNKKFDETEDGKGSRALSGWLREPRSSNKHSRAIPPSAMGFSQVVPEPRCQWPQRNGHPSKPCNQKEMAFNVNGQSFKLNNLSHAIGPRITSHADHHRSLPRRRLLSPLEQRTRAGIIRAVPKHGVLAVSNTT